MPRKIVIVGAGINGLVAANYLKRSGYTVTLIEKNHHQAVLAPWNHLHIIICIISTHLVPQYSD